jgi:hypothetical protein
MESPTTLIKSAISPGTVLKGIIGFIVIAAIFDLIGYSDALFRPVSFFKSKFMSNGG